MVPRTLARASATLAMIVACSLAPVANSAAPAVGLPPVDVSGDFRIMPLGDSITVGVGGTTGDSYRWPLAQYLTEVQQIGTANWVGSQVSGQQPNPSHEGHSGWRLNDLASQASGWMAAARPDVVLLHAGVNDARNGATAEQMAGRMQTLLTTVLSSSTDVRVIVGDVIPPWYGTQNDEASATVQRFNAMLPGITADAGPRVRLARMSAAVPSNLLADGLHPNDTGYRYMAWVWWRCMSPLLSSDGITRWGRDPMPVTVPQSVLCP